MRHAACRRNRYCIGGRSASVAAAVFALAVLSWRPAAAVEMERELSLGLGYRAAELDWNIAGTLAGTGPNILSELSWRDLQIADVHAAAEFRIAKRLLLHGRAAYGAVLDGDNQDSDYAGNNRTLEFSRSSNRGGGELGEGSVGVGYQFWWLDPSVGRHARFIPQFGYAWRGHYLDITDGRQVIPASAAGPIPNLNSSYHAQWQGPWLGVAIDMDASEQSRIALEFEYHYADFRAEADWNLRDDWAHPVSFIHETRANGVIAAIAFDHTLGKRLGLEVRVESQRFKGDPGIDIINTINDSTGAIERMATRLNAVEWQSLGGHVALRWRF